MISSSSFIGNNVVGLTPHGGAIAAFVATVSISNGTFSGNRVGYLTAGASLTTEIPSRSFGSLSGGAIYLYEPVQVTISAGSSVRVMM